MLIRKRIGSTVVLDHVATRGNNLDSQRSVTSLQGEHVSSDQLLRFVLRCGTVGTDAVFKLAVFRQLLGDTAVPEVLDRDLRR